MQALGELVGSKEQEVLDLRARISLLEGLLERHEWMPAAMVSLDHWCPECLRPKGKGHTESCKLAKALRKETA